MIAYTLRHAETDQLLSGDMSDALIEASMATSTGIVRGRQVDGVWTLDYDGQRVYVETVVVADC